MQDTVTEEIKITQSLIKSYQDYRNGDECGHVLVAKFFEKKWGLFKGADSEPIQLGSFFEYQATGNKPKDGSIPQPRYSFGKNGKTLAEPYQLMMEHVANFNAIIKTYGFKILSVGEKIVWEDCTGDTDIIAEATKDIEIKDGPSSKIFIKQGTKVIIDLKASGLLDNRYDDRGWHLDTLHTKWKITAQPVHYKFIWAKNTSEDIPFLFFLFNQKDSRDFRIVLFDVDMPTVMENYEHVTIASMRKAIANMRKKNFRLNANPTTKRCSECPLAPTCKDKVEVPNISVVKFTFEV